LFTFPFSDSDFQTPGDRADGVSSRQTQHLLTNSSPTLYLKCEYQTYSHTTLGGSISSRKREDHYPPVSPPPPKGAYPLNINFFVSLKLSLESSYHLLTNIFFYLLDETLSLERVSLFKHSNNQSIY